MVDLIRDALSLPTQQNNTITAEMNVITSLGYLATEKLQQCSEDDLGLSQPSIRRMITQTIRVLSQPHIVTQFIWIYLDVIHIMQSHERALIDKASFPSDVTVIDGMYI